MELRRLSHMRDAHRRNSARGCHGSPRSRRDPDARRAPTTVPAPCAPPWHPMPRSAIAHLKLRIVDRCPRHCHSPLLPARQLRIGDGAPPLAPQRPCPTHGNLPKSRQAQMGNADLHQRRRMMLGHSADGILRAWLAGT
jgi:hypothetical protein